MRKWILISCLGLLLMSCNQSSTSAERQVTFEQVGTITEIDKDARRVVLRADGRLITLRVAESVAAFDDLEIRDRVRFQYEEAVAVSMALPSEAEAAASDAAHALSLMGGSTGTNSTEEVLLSATFVEYDQRDKRATLELADGSSLSVFVPSELRGFARARSRGDQILITSAISRVISIEKQG